MHNVIINLLITYKYPILIPIALAEGHVVSLISGFLARMGYLNIFGAWACIVIGNLIGDVLLYWFGYHYGERFVKRWGRYISLDDTSIEKAKKIYHKYKNSILFTSKMTNGLGLATAVLFTAGMMKIPFGIFMFWNILGESLWSGMLILLGYFLGNAYYVVDNIVLKIGIVVGVLVVLAIIFFQVRRYFKNKINV